MSVLIGFISQNIVILAGDKRGSDKNGNILKNDIEKVIPINNHLAIACAGNMAIGKAVLIDINKIENKSQMVVEDVINVIQKFYKDLIDKELKSLIQYQASFLVGGINNSGKTALFTIHNHNGQLKITEVVDIPFEIIPPEDIRMDRACNILMKNLQLSPKRYIERAIYEISEISNLVSKDGDKWTYDIRANSSRIEKI